jgi:hypothetical protein
MVLSGPKQALQVGIPITSPRRRAAMDAMTVVREEEKNGKYLEKQKTLQVGRLSGILVDGLYQKSWS